jgi:hypothetical protein
VANEQNLRPPWKPGESGNPKGKPKGAKSFKTILTELMEIQLKDPKLLNSFKKKFPELIDLKKGKTPKELIMIRLMAEAMGGNMQATKELLERFDGKVTDKTEISGGIQIVPLSKEDEKL